MGGWMSREHPGVPVRKDSTRAPAYPLLGSSPPSRLTCYPQINVSCFSWSLRETNHFPIVNSAQIFLPGTPEECNHTLSYWVEDIRTHARDPRSRLYNPTHPPLCVLRVAGSLTHMAQPGQGAGRHAVEHKVSSWAAPKMEVEHVVTSSAITANTWLRALSRN